MFIPNEHGWQQILFKMERTKKYQRSMTKFEKFNKASWKIYSDVETNWLFISSSDYWSKEYYSYISTTVLSNYYSYSNLIQKRKKFNANYRVSQQGETSTFTLRYSPGSKSIICRQSNDVESPLDCEDHREWPQSTDK